MPELALAKYDELVESCGDHEHPLLREAVARALLEKGRTLLALGRSSEALSVFRAALERTQGDSLPDLRSEVTSALTAFEQ